MSGRAQKPDVGADLRAVGGFFKKLVGFTKHAERVVKEAQTPEREESAEREREGAIVVEVLPAPNVCGVCGGKKVVGGAVKVPCPMCAKSAKKR